MTKEQFVNQKLMLFLAFSLVACQLFVFYPAITWMQNQFNFNTPFTEGLPVIGVMILAIMLLASLITYLLPSTIRKILLPWLLVASVILFIQQNIMVGDYGVIDGKNMTFQSSPFLAWADILIWGAGVIIALCFGKKIIKQAKLILTFSTLASCLIVLTTALSYDFSANRSTYSITEEHKFQYSNEKNVLVFVLDGFQSDLFLHMLDHDPELYQQLSGFEFFPNTTAVFAKTYPTIPLLLAGKVYKKEQPLNDFFLTAYDDSLLTDLIESGWDVGLYPYLKRLLPVSDQIMSNAVNNLSLIDKLTDYIYTIDLSILRSSPHVLKPHVFNDGQFILKSNTGALHQQKWLIYESESVYKQPKSDPHHGLNFLSNMQSFANTESNKPSFRFYHLLMPHSPFLLDRNLAATQNANGFQAYLDYAYASMKLMIGYLEAIKALGIYNQTAVMIVADHGGGEYTNLQYDSEQGFVAVNEFGREKASAKPLLLVKGFNQSDRLKVSNKPVSLTDVMPTLAKLTDQTVRGVGQPINEIENNQQRKRIYYHYHFTGFDSKYLQDFNRFVINGDVYDPSSWEHAGTISTQFEHKPNPEANYRINKTARFGSDIKTGADYTNQFLINQNLNFGHSYVSTNAEKFILSLPINPKDFKAQVYSAELMLAATEPNTKTDIFLNDKKLTTLQLSTEMKTYKIPFLLQDSDLHKLEFILQKEDKATDSSLLLSQMMVIPLTINEFIDESKEINFNSPSLYCEGCWKAEKWGRWTKKKAVIPFVVGPNFCENYLIHIDILRFYDGVDPTQFKVFVNNKPIPLTGTGYADGGTPLSFQCDLPLPQKRNLFTLTLQTNTTQSPSQVNGSKDRRQLGLGIKRISFQKNNTKQP